MLGRGKDSMPRVRKSSLKHHIFLQALDLYAKGYSQLQIGQTLHLSQQQISRILSQIHEESKDMLPHYLTEIIPWEIRRSLITYDEVQREASKLVEHNDPRIKQLGLSLIMNVTSERNSLLSSLHGVNEAIQTIRARALEQREEQVEQLNNKIANMITDAQTTEQARIGKPSLPSPAEGEGHHESDKESPHQ